MSKWILEPGHTEAGFRAKHMMVTWVCGFFKNIKGEMQFDAEKVNELSFSFTIETAKLWTGVEQRDDHLRSVDFFDAKRYPTITFETTSTKKISANSFEIVGNLKMRGVIKSVIFFMDYLGKWKTPYWTDEGNAGSVTRIGFRGKTVINRHDWNISWNDEMEDGGSVVSNEIYVDLDLEALLESEMLLLDN